MGEERLVVDFERRADGGALLRVSGKLDAATAALLDGVLLALRAEMTAVVLDLSGVEHIDRRGLDLLLDAEAEAMRTGASIAVIGVGESLRDRRGPTLE
jgi:anti-anti-sigma factor